MFFRNIPPPLCSLSIPIHSLFDDLVTQIQVTFGMQYQPLNSVLSYGLSMIPGIVVSIHHLMAFALTADQLVSEIEQGLLIRGYTCGLSLQLTLTCQLIAHFMVIIPQVN